MFLPLTVAATEASAAVPLPVFEHAPRTIVTSPIRATIRVSFLALYTVDICSFKLDDNGRFDTCRMAVALDVL
jgi:hypothetical protein